MQAGLPLVQCMRSTSKQVINYPQKSQVLLTEGGKLGRKGKYLYQYILKYYLILYYQRQCDLIIIIFCDEWQGTDNCD